MKKNIFKKSTLLFLILLTITILVGCGSNEKEAAFIGVWKMEFMESEEVGNLTAEDLVMLGAGESFIDLKEDKTGKFSIAGEDILIKWKVDGDNLLFKGEGNENTIGKLEDGKLIIEDEGTKMVFSK